MKRSDDYYRGMARGIGLYNIYKAKSWDDLMNDYDNPPGFEQKPGPYHIYHLTHETQTYHDTSNGLWYIHDIFHDIDGVFYTETIYVFRSEPSQVDYSIADEIANNVPRFWELYTEGDEAE